MIMIIMMIILVMGKRGCSEQTTQDVGLFIVIIMTIVPNHYDPDHHGHVLGWLL